MRAANNKSSSRRSIPGERYKGKIKRALTLEGIWDTLLSEEEDPVAKCEKELDKHLEDLYGTPVHDLYYDDFHPLRLRRGSGFEYQSFGPPPWFEAPYAVLRVRAKERNEEFMTHGGEEVLLPLQDSPQLEYEFYWPSGSKPPWKQERVISVGPGEFIRVNSTLLHRNRRISKSGEVNAWIILRPESFSPAALTFRIRNTATGGPKRNFDEGDLEKWLTKTENSKEYAPAKFLLLESGLLEKIRNRRARGDLSEKELSTISGLNRLFTARLEGFKLRNVSIESLFKLSKQLDVDLRDAIRSLRWAYDMQALSLLATTKENPISCLKAPPHNSPHRLHPALLRLAKGQSWTCELTRSSGEIASVIVLRGSLVAVIEGPKTMTVSAGHVLHLRRHERAVLGALLEDAEALFLRCGTTCSCEPWSEPPVAEAKDEPE